MKLKYLLPIVCFTLFFSCSTDDNDDTMLINEVENLQLIKTIENGDQSIELYNEKGMFETGYNMISLRIKDNNTNTYVEDATISWMPVMQMPTMQHSCPKSEITKAIGKDTVYQGFIIYQMTFEDGSGWSLTLDYTINDVDYSVTETINVMQYENQNTASFMGSDDSRYIVALIAPKAPSIAINNMKVGLFKMENMMTFPVVEDYTIGGHEISYEKELTLSTKPKFTMSDSINSPSGLCTGSQPLASMPSMFLTMAEGSWMPHQLPFID